MFVAVKMKLEQEIKQTKAFKSEFQKLVINIQFTSSWLNARFSQQLKKYDITPQQFNVLKILKGKYPESYCNLDIAERMIDRSSNCTRIADKLKTKKLIVRTENKSDRRAVDIKITEKGLELLAEIEANLNPSKLKTIPFNEEKARLMNEWLDEIRE